MPKTPGKDDAFKVYDPARVSHLLADWEVRHPGGVAGLLAVPGPRVFGATPLDHVARKTGTHKGCFVPHSSQLDEWLRCFSNALPLGIGDSLPSKFAKDW